MSKPVPDLTTDELTALTAEGLDEREAAIASAGAAIAAKGPDQVTDEDLSVMESLSGQLAAVRSERDSRTARAEKLSGFADTFTTTSNDTGEDEDSDEDTEPVAETEPEPADETEKEPALTAAAPAKRRTPSVAAIASKAKAPNVPAIRDEDAPRMVAAADLHGYSAGSEFASMIDVAQAVASRISGYANAGRNVGPLRNPVMSVRGNLPDALRVDDPRSAQGVLDFAVDQYRQRIANPTGNALVAAGAWCGPLEPIWDLCAPTISLDGMVDLPSIQVTRSGITWARGVDFCQAWTLAAGWHHTADQYDPGDPRPVKPCVEIDCPPFEEALLEIIGLCVTGDILQRATYPERLAQFISQLLAAHQHRINQAVIAAMVAKSGTAINLATAAAPIGTDNGATGVLAGVELAVEDLRYKYRLAFNATVEVVLPHWVLPQLRADLSRKNGVDLLSVSDAQIVSYFTARGVRLQFVYDWQDASDGTAGGLGNCTTPATGYPATFQILVYTPGAFVRGGNNILTLDTIYDSTNLATNHYTALWTEESILVAQMCGESRLYTLDLCPGGNSGAQIDYCPTGA